MAEEKINFDEEEEKLDVEEKEMTEADFQGGNYLKNKPVGEVLTFAVDKIINNPNTSGVNNTTGAAFTIGLVDKNKKIKRIDIHTAEQGIYIVGSWEIYFKLFGREEGLLMAHAKEHKGSFKGAKVSIKRNFNGQHASTEINDLAKIKETTVEEAKKYQDQIKDAMKQRKLYEVTLE